MFLEQLSLKNFRNYCHEIIKFSKHINIFLGSNAQGKTNLIESIYILSTTKSYRLKKDKDLILFNHEFSKINATISKNNHLYDIEYIIYDKGKNIKVNHIEQKKISEYIGLFNVVLFAPEDLNLIKGQPNIRRKFIDVELSKLNSTYLKYISYYQKILKQRNQYLKKYTNVIDIIYLEILTEQLVHAASHIIFYRLNFIKSIEKYANHILNIMTENKEVLLIKYISQLEKINLDNSNTITVEEIKNLYLKLFKENQKKEIDSRTTLYGPHRDDLQFLLNDKDVQLFGSQGQQRTVILCMKLAEIDLIKEQTKEYPILLLDDVLSELDNYRQTFLLKSIEDKVQTFITTTNIDSILKNIIKTPQIFYIEKGSVTIDTNESRATR